MRVDDAEFQKLKAICSDGADDAVRSIVTCSLLRSLIQEIERLGELAVDPDGEMCSLHRKLGPAQSVRAIDLYGNHESITLAGKAIDAWIAANC